MEHKPIKSSNIQSAGYDPESKTMEVRFTNGSTYEYNDVSQDDFDALMKANDDPEVSTGSWFHKNIKSRYAGKKKEDA